MTGSSRFPAWKAVFFCLFLRWCIYGMIGRENHAKNAVQPKVYIKKRKRNVVFLEVAREKR